MPVCVWYSVDLRGKWKASIYIFVCLSVCLPTFLLIVVFIVGDGGNRGAVTFDVKGDIDEYKGGEGRVQETWDFVVTAVVLTLGDTGTTWHYTLTAR